MDLYIVDVNTWQKQGDPIDSFVSLVWTERYNDSGDCTLVVPATEKYKAALVEDVFLHMPASPDIMRIETVSIKDGLLTAQAKSLVDFLKHRMMHGRYNDKGDSWITTSNPPGTLANNFVVLFATSGGTLGSGGILSAAQAANEYIPKLTVGTPTSGTATTFTIPYGTLFDAVKIVCDGDGLGFRIYPPSLIDGSGNIIFQNYRGLDRTTSQSTNGQIIFDSALDNFANVEELRSKAGYKNVAWVFPAGATSQSQVGVAYAPGAAALSGWQRQSMCVDASDINAPDYSAATLQTMLTQKGMDALANNNYVRMLDGQLVPQTQFVYGTDYGLGDVIELRNNTTTAQKARVVEYIRSQDSTGETAYPTLSVIS